MPHMVDNLLFPHDVFPHLIHIERIVFDVIAFALLGSQIRPVVHRIDGEIPLPDHIDSDCRHHIKSKLVLSETHAHVAHKLQHRLLAPVRHADAENVRLDSSVGNLFRISRKFPDLLRDIL